MEKFFPRAVSLDWPRPQARETALGMGWGGGGGVLINGNLRHCGKGKINNLDNERHISFVLETLGAKSVDINCTIGTI